MWRENVRALLYLTKAHHLSGLFRVSILKAATKNCMKRTAQVEALALYRVLWLQLLHHFRLCLRLGWGSGWLGAGGLLNLSISGGKAAAWARPAHPRPHPYFG